MAAVVESAPKLIPLLSHHYLPATPHEAGNPVFSVYQSDVIYYGTNLDEYFKRELGREQRNVLGPIKRIAFWSELTERDGVGALYSR